MVNKFLFLVFLTGCADTRVHVGRPVDMPAVTEEHRIAMYDYLYGSGSVELLEESLE